MAVENAVRPWECGSGLISPEAFPLQTPSWILQISLHWLLLNAEPAIERLSWYAETDGVESCADQAITDFVRFGLPFLEKIDTAEKLIHLLQKIDDYPKRTPAHGPRSADPNCYAALLLHRLGRNNEAVEELDTAMRIETARIQRLFPESPRRDEAMKIRSCVIARYRRYIATQ